MLYSVEYDVGEIVFCFEGYFNISMFKEFCNIFGVRPCILDGLLPLFWWVFSPCFICEGCG